MTTTRLRHMARTVLIQAIRSKVDRRYRTIIDKASRIVVLGTFHGPEAHRQYWTVLRLVYRIGRWTSERNLGRRVQLLAIGEFPNETEGHEFRAGPLEGVDWCRWLLPFEGGYQSDVQQKGHRLRLKHEKKKGDHGRPAKAAWE